MLIALPGGLIGNQEHQFFVAIERTKAFLHLLRYRSRPVPAYVRFDDNLTSCLPGFACQATVEHMPRLYVRGDIPVPRWSSAVCSAGMQADNDTLLVPVTSCHQNVSTRSNFGKDLGMRTPCQARKTQFVQFMGPGNGLVERCAFVDSGWSRAHGR